MFRNSQVRVQLVNLNNNPQIFRYRDLYASSEVQGISCGSSRYKFRQEFNEMDPNLISILNSSIFSCKFRPSRFMQS